MCFFLHRHIPKFAEIAVPLTNLTRTNVKFQWTAHHQRAFDEMKSKLITAPILANPDFSKEFHIHTDASKVAIGSCLMQQGSDGKEHAIACYSRKMKGAETWYSVTDCEALAVVETVQAFDTAIHLWPYVYHLNRSSPSAVYFSEAH